MSIGLPPRRTQPPPADFGARQQKTFDVAIESIKQLISVASAAIAFTIAPAFSKDIVPVLHPVIGTLSWMWGVYFASITCGVWAISALAGQLTDDPSGAGDPPSIDNIVVSRLWRFQQIFFGIGLLLTLYIAHYAVVNLKPAPTAPVAPCVCASSTTNLANSAKTKVKTNNANDKNGRNKHVTVTSPPNHPFDHAK